MSDERKQKLRDSQIDYQKKYYAAKKLIKLLMIVIMIFVTSQ